MADGQEELDHSVLGTRDYWDKHYTREVSNFNECGDIGEVWFGEDSAIKMVRWLERNVDNMDARIADLGCGNAHLLFELAEAGYTDLTGLDYSQPAIELARLVAIEKGLIKSDTAEETKEKEGGDEEEEEEEEGPEVKLALEVCDILSSESAAKYDGAFDVLCDKGTYDAISLHSPEFRLSFLANVRSFVKTGGFVLITSCNWTNEELKTHFLGTGRYELHSEIKQPSFKFGGQVGQTIATVSFRAI